MARVLITAFLSAKMRDPKTSAALFAVSSDVDGAAMAQRVRVRINKAIVGLLASAREPLNKEPQIVASMLQSAITGVSHRLLESGNPEKDLNTVRDELIFFVAAYLEASTARQP
jgi:hypothetical protein